MQQTWIEQMKAGHLQLGVCIMYPAPGIVERIGPDWDWVWLDGQHGEIECPDMLALVRSCDLVQRPAVVRVPSHEFGMIGKVLDMGAAGVMVPLVNSAAQAAAIVQAAKFPPLGDRSYGGRRLIDRQGRLYADTANRDRLLIVQIESPEGLQNAEAIAAVPGVDALFYGPDDVKLRRGEPMNAKLSLETIRQDMVRIAEACQKHGKIAGTVGINPNVLTICRQLRCNLVVAGGDAVFLAEQSRQAANTAREAL